MATKRKSAPEDPVKTIRKLIGNIRKELSCTEAEAYFTLRTIASPPPPVFFERNSGFPELLGGPALDSRKRAFNYTRDLLAKLDEYRVKAEKGNFAAFLRAVQLCGACGFPLPKWFTQKTQKAHQAYQGHEVVTLDEAFGSKRPRYYRQEKARRDGSTIPWNVYHRCHRLLMEGKKTPDIFRIAGKEYGVSATIASEYYYALKRKFPTD